MTTEETIAAFQADIATWPADQLLVRYLGAHEDCLVNHENIPIWKAANALRDAIKAELLRRLTPPTARKLELRRVDVTTPAQAGPFELTTIALPGEPARMFVVRYEPGFRHYHDEDVLAAIKASFPGVKGGLIFMPEGGTFEIWEETP